MSDGTLRNLIEQHWTALEADQATGERRLRVSELPVTTVNGAVAVGVDHNGHRHVLVPVHAHQKIRAGLDGPVLHLRRRDLEDANTYQAYADLGCLRSDLDDLFTVMCADVLGATEAMPDKPVKALYRVLDRWRALLRAEGAPLRQQQLAGLTGELLVLNQLLEHDPSAHRLWLGPGGYRHDFTAATTAVEVKATIGSEGRRPRIHGLDQLEAPAGGRLCLAWYRLQPSAKGGAGFLELIGRALRLCDDESALLELLSDAGYRSSDIDHYRDVRFVTIEERWYEVDPEFPKLTGRDLALAGVPVSAIDVEYTVDISGESPAPLASDEVTEVLNTMIQESA